LVSDASRVLRCARLWSGQWQSVTF
jgi:hypothetical protein